jgi:MFS family permease
LTTDTRESLESSDAARAALPKPPTLHWALVWLFSVATFGLFALAWAFVQVRWVRRLDPRSNALALLCLAVSCLMAGCAVAVLDVLWVAGANVGMAIVLLIISRMLMLGWFVLHVVAYFTMADSLRRYAASQRLGLAIGGGTLFFFTVYYLQGQLRWLARWKVSGETTPAAPQGVFWALTFVLIALAGLVAAIAVPRYMDRTVRKQVAAGDVAAKAAGLARSGSISGRYVSSVDVAAGVVTVGFDSPGTTESLRHQTLVYFPVITQKTIRWDCSAFGTVPHKSLPLSCRN